MQRVKLSVVGGELKSKTVVTVLRHDEIAVRNTFENPAAAIVMAIIID